MYNPRFFELAQMQLTHLAPLSDRFEWALQNGECDPYGSVEALMQEFNATRRLCVAELSANILIPQTVRDNAAFPRLIALEQTLFSNRCRFGASAYVILAHINYYLTEQYNEKIRQLEAALAETGLSRLRRPTLKTECQLQEDIRAQHWRKVYLYLRVAEYLEPRLPDKDRIDLFGMTTLGLVQQKLQKKFPQTPQSIAEAVALIGHQIRELYPINGSRLLHGVDQEAGALVDLHLRQPALITQCFRW